MDGWMKAGIFFNGKRILKGFIYKDYLHIPNQVENMFDKRELKWIQEWRRKNERSQLRARARARRT